MSASDSGSWKLFLYPIIIILVIGVVLNLTVTPFIDEGIPVETTDSGLTTVALNIINSGNVFNITEIHIPLLVTTWDFPIPNIFDFMPSGIKEFLLLQVSIFTWLPSVIQVPLAIILVLALCYALYVMIAMLIP